MQLNDKQLNNIAQRFKSESEAVKPSTDLARKIINNFSADDVPVKQPMFSWFSVHIRFVATSFAVVVLATVVSVSVVNKNSKTNLVKQTNNDFMDTALVMEEAMPVTDFAAEIPVEESATMARMAKDVGTPESAMMLANPEPTPIETQELATLEQVDQELALAFSNFETDIQNLDALLDQSDFSGF